MTEYDYSPEAYEKYVANQNRVFNWVNQTKAHERAYANPFVPSDTESSSSHGHHHSYVYVKPQPHRSKSSGSAGNISVRTTRDRDVYGPPQRSKTLDSKTSPMSSGTTSPTKESRPSPSRSRSFTTTSQETRSKPRSRSQGGHSHSHSHSHSHGGSHSYYTQPQQPPMPTHHRSHSYQQQPIRSNSTPPVHVHASQPVKYTTYDNRGASGPIQLPPPRPGETYVIIPPQSGRRVEVISPKGNVAYTNSPPPRGAKEPLLKRLLGSITGSSAGSLRRETRESGQRLEKRARRRSTY